MTTPLEVGVSQIEINPRIGMQLDGNIGQHRPCQRIADPIVAQVMVFRQGDRICCLVTLDLLSVMQEWTDRIREIATRRFGIPGDAVIVHVSQTHSAPSLGHLMLSDRLPATRKWPWLRGGDAAYNEGTLAKIETAMAEAMARLRPATLLYGGTVEGRVAFNRRYVVKGGKSEMMPPVQRIIAMEGPTDPDLGVVSLVGEDGEAIAVLLHHTSHPVHDFPTPYSSADWPGVWRRQVATELCPAGVTMVVNGCCGNVVHWNQTDPTFSSTPQKMGGILAESTLRAAKDLVAQEGPVLDWARTVIELPYRSISADEFEAAHRYIDEHPDPIWKDATQSMTQDRDWCYAASLLDVEELFTKGPTFPYEIQAIRIGDVAILAVMGEPFVEGQIQIKAHSPAKRTIVAHMCNGYAGYIPTPHALRGGGYEAKVSMGSKFGVDALDMIVEGSLNLLRQLFAR